MATSSIVSCGSYIVFWLGRCNSGIFIHIHIICSQTTIYREICRVESNSTFTHDTMDHPRRVYSTRVVWSPTPFPSCESDFPPSTLTHRCHVCAPLIVAADNLAFAVILWRVLPRHHRIGHRFVHSITSSVVRETMSCVSDHRFDRNVMQQRALNVVFDLIFNRQ